MIDTEIIIEMAKLAGDPTPHKPTEEELASGSYSQFEPNYLTSRDAIIPVIEKQFNRHTCHAFFDTLGLEAIKDWQDVDFNPSYEGDGSYFEQWVLFKATPRQLCIALLKATGKWKNEQPKEKGKG